MPGRANGSVAGGQSHAGYAPGQARSSAQKQAQPAAQPRKPRRTSGKEYLIAARTRRQQQEFRNFHHPPTLEETWICEFCEYERIFGTPPVALIRQYEIKDRRVRKQEAERRRLLEKAKMKGRKGKKGGKTAPKALATSQQDRQAIQHHDQRAPPAHHSSHSQDTQSEDYYEDGEYDDGYHVEEPVAPAHSFNNTARRTTAPSQNGHNPTTAPAGGGNSGGERLVS